MQDEIHEVLRFVAQPLKLRNKLLNGECKLVLNSSILFKINKVLDVIGNESVDIILSDGERRELQVLSNVFNSIPKLTITQKSADSFEKVINLSKFKRLRHLELTRVCLHLVVGLDTLKTQLESFICNRCTKYNGVLSKQKELEWPELKYFNLRYMKLDSTSSRFFMNKPWIQVLDISFNQLRIVNGLDYLDHLVFLNVSFNYLESIPKLSKDAEKKLEMLTVNNNYISSLAGLEKLSALKYLDVNYNFISCKSEYSYLSHLKELKSLNFACNPVSSIQFSTTYLAASLSKEVDRDKLLLNHRPLNNVEYHLVGRKFGTCKHYQSSCNQPETSNSNETLPNAPEPKSKFRRPGKRISKPREAIIEELPTVVHPDDSLPESLPKPEERVPESVFLPNIAQETTNKENELMEQLSKLEIETDSNSKKNVEADSKPLESPHDVVQKLNSDDLVILNTLQQEGNVFQDIESDIETSTVLISATVHASDSGSVDILNTQCEGSERELTDNNHEELLENASLKSNASEKSDVSEKSNASEGNLPSPANSKSSVVEYRNEANAVSADDMTKLRMGYFKPVHQTLLHNMDNNDTLLFPNESFIENESENQDKGISLTTDSDEAYSDTEDEVFWQVKSVEKTSGRISNVILVLLDDELKERSTQTGRTMTRWKLHKVQSCAKTKNDPVTVELEFDTLKKDKQFRIYIMEFPDAQVLLKKVYSLLESRPLSVMNQKTYECIKCGSFFVRNNPGVFRSRDSQVNCAVCSSTLVIEVEEPKLPEAQPLSHSSSHSSIGNDNLNAEEAACTEWKPCSATSLEQHSMQDRRLSMQRYESDIEVISNPSQSSIEVLGEHSRSVTPRRKTSSDEKMSGVHFPTQLTTVIEVNSPFTNLTESSSSGSLTESVITAYEAINNNRKTIIPEGTLAEEDGSLTSEQDSLSEGFEEEKPTSVWRKETDIYSFNDFTDVDPRIKLFLYQSLFQDDNETLLLLVKCHVWRTGGSDFDGCAVFSTSKVYFLSHSKTNFKQDYCDWLTLLDTYSIKDIKDISPMIWQQGARVQLKRLSYLIILMDQERTASLFRHMRGFLTDVKIQNNVSSNYELSLQQAVLSSTSAEKSPDPTVVSFSMCLSVSVIKDEVEDEVLRLGCMVMTASEFHVLPGDLSWLTTGVVPSVVTSQDISSLIEVEMGKCFISLHFLDEKEAMEEVWCLKLVSEAHASQIVDSIKTPWEQIFSEPLDVTVRS